MPEGFSHTTRTNAELDARARRRRRRRVQQKRLTTARGDTPMTKEQRREVSRKETPRQKAKRLGVPYVRDGGKRSGVGGIIDTGDVKEVEDAIIGLPAGLYGLSRDVAKDVSQGTLITGRKGKKSRTRRNVKAIGEAMYRDVRHPLRNPLLTALTVSGVAAAGAGTAARGAAATSAARAARTAGKSPAKEAASAALKRPVPGKREHIYEGQKIAGRYSTSAASRGVQKLHDRASRKRGQYRVESGKTERLSTISGRKAARLLSEERRIEDARVKAPILGLAAMEKGTSTPKQLAIDVVASGVPVEKHIAMLRSTAAGAKGKARKQATRRAQLLEASKEYLELAPDGRPVISAKYPKLQQIAQKAESVSNRRTERLVDAGVLSEKGAEARVHGAGRVTLGAEFRPKSLAELRGPQFNLIGKRVRTGNDVRGVIVDVSGDTATIRPWSKRLGPTIEAHLDDVFPATRKVTGGRLVGGGRAVERERPRTVEEAQAQLTQLDKKVDDALKEMVEREYQASKTEYDLAAGQTGQKAASNKRVRPEDVVRRKHAGSSAGINEPGIDIQRSAERAEYFENPQANVLPRLKQTGRELAEAEVLSRLRKSNHPVAQKFIAAVDEAAKLSRAVEAHTEPAWMREAGQELPDLGTVSETIAFEQFAGGRFRVPEARRGKTLKGQAQFQGGIPRKPGTLTNPYTGALRRTGRNTPQVIRAIVDDALEAERWLSLDRFRQRVIPMGHKARPADTASVKYSPVRVDTLRPQDAQRLRKTLADVDPEKITPDEAARIEAALDQYREHLFPERELATTPAGEEIRGVVWVDKRLLESNRKIIGSLGPVDVIQDAAKGLILYGKPGYVAPNVAGNVGLNIFQQGFLAPVNWYRAVRLPRDLGFMVDEVMGAGYARALATGTKSPISGAVQKAGNFWSLFVDEPFRRAAFVHEARRYGFKSEEQMRDLILNPQHAPLADEVIQRSRDAIIDYERLGPVERDLVRRMIFVYPWIKGSTYYAGQFLRDHPILAATFAKIGEEGTARSLQDLGPVPAWAEGSFKVFERDGTPFVVNPAAISPFQTPAQVVASARGSFGGVERSEQLGEFTSPVFQAGVEALFGRDLFTGRELGGGYPQRFGGQLGKGLPQYRLYKRIAEADEPGTQEKAYPYGVGSAIGQFVGGSSAPRPINLDTINEQATTRNPAQRVARRMSEAKEEVLLGLRQNAPEDFNDPETRKVLDQSYRRKQAVDTARLKARLSTGDGDPYQRAALREETAVLLSWGVADRDEAAELRRIAEKGSPDEVKAVREELSDTFDELYGAPLRELREAAGVK